MSYLNKILLSSSLFAFLSFHQAMAAPRYFDLEDLPTIEVNLDVLKELEASQEVVPVVPFEEEPKKMKAKKKKNKKKKSSKPKKIFDNEKPQSKKIDSVPVEKPAVTQPIEPPVVTQPIEQPAPVAPIVPITPLPASPSLEPENKFDENLNFKKPADELMPPGVVEQENGRLHDLDKEMKKDELPVVPLLDAPAPVLDEKSLKVPSNLENGDAAKSQENLVAPLPTQTPELEKKPQGEPELPSLQLLKDFQEPQNGEMQKGSELNPKDGLPGNSQSTISNVNLGSKFSFTFPEKSSILNEEQKASLEKIASMMGDNDSAKLSIVGYANTDADLANRRFALQRVISVRKFMIDKGIDASRIQIKAISNEAAGASGNLSDVEISFTDQISEFKY